MYYTVHTVSLSVSLCVFVLLFFLLQGDKSLIPGGLLGARTSDASQNNNIQGKEFLQHPLSVGIEAFRHCSAHFHTYCLFCLLWMHLYQDPSRKESVFFKTNLAVVNTAEMPLWSDFSQRQNVFSAFLKHTHTNTSRGAQEQSTYNTASLGNRL